MNVIISKDKSVRFTQESSSAYNIQDISFYISKQIEVEDAILKLKSFRSIYPFVLAPMGSSTNYNIYKVYFTQAVNLSVKEYELIVVINSEDVNIGTFSLQAIKAEAPVMMRFMSPTLLAEGEEGSTISDEHEPIEIEDRDIKISANQNVIVAEDNVSQEIRFRMKKTYDNVDLLNSGKEFWFDYLLTTTNEFGDKVTNLWNEELQATVDDKDDTYMILSLVVPFAMTQQAGNLPFAISIIDPVGDYVWQTKPSSLSIQKNLFKRNIVPEQNNSQTGLQAILAEIDAIEQATTEQNEALRVDLETTAEAISTRVTNIESSDIYNVDTNIDDEEVIFGGGGADSVKEV